MATSTYSAHFRSPRSQVHQDTFQTKHTHFATSSVQEALPSIGLKRRILLVDDDADIRSLVRAFLESDGFEVFSCGDGHRASDLFRTRNDIDLLLTDMQMPEVSGLTLANQLTELKPSLPVVVMSGAIQTSATEKLIASKGWRFLAKPFHVPQLLRTVHELLTSARLSA
jgi:two-component system, NtrC family, phosphoglycerate transport system response regulator PgtA